MKKVLTLITTICLFVTLSGVGYGEENKSTTIIYHVNPNYTVTIPSTATLGSDLIVSASNVVIEYGKKLNVKISSDFKLSNNDYEVAYNITSGTNTIESGDIVLTVDPASANSGSSTLTLNVPNDGFKYAGDYSGTLNFTISVE